MAVITELCSLSYDLAIVVGAPSVNPEVEGKDLYNSAFFYLMEKCNTLLIKHCCPTMISLMNIDILNPIKTLLL